jgi:hypothetical protein
LAILSLVPESLKLSPSSQLSCHWSLLAIGTFVAIETYLPSELFVATGNVVANNEVCFKMRRQQKHFNKSEDMETNS